jgi:predicted Ser/Thr protein kinase
MMAGELSETARAEVAIHAASCEPCHALIESLLERGQEVTVTGGSPREGELVLGVGARVGRFVVDARLGAGGMGVVYAASDSELERRVALKLLRPESDADGSVGRERLLREARTLARLSHPNVVTVFDVGRHDGHVFIAMELVEGGSLSAWLARTPRTPHAILARVIEAGRGLAAAHTAGVVHRDVKPDNILVGRDDRARVTDFGLARLGEQAVPEGASPDRAALQIGLTRTGTVMGTPAYMAPEHFTRGQTDALTDQWSFCATAYEALAGVRPFPTDDVEARVSAIAEGRLATPLDGHRVPARVRAILLRGLRADPAARWPSLDAVVAALDHQRHRPRGRYVAAGVLAAAAVAGAFVMSRGDRVEAQTSWPGWNDDRPGCSCPFSPCIHGRCTAMCGSASFTVGGPLPGLDVENRQEILLGASSDGNTILYLAGELCTANRLFLARRRGDVYVSVELTDHVDRRLAFHEGCCTLTADGHTVIFATADRTGLAAVRLDGDRLQPGARELLAAPRPVPIRHPVLSADQLTLYYLQEDPDGQIEGIFVVERPDREARFGEPRRLQGVRNFEYVTGIASDGQTLFLTNNFQTAVLVRANKAEMFRSATWTTVTLPGWRAIPLADCGGVITTLTASGCHDERISVLRPE